METALERMDVMGLGVRCNYLREENQYPGPLTEPNLWPNISAELKAHGKDIFNCKEGCSLVTFVH